jgi:hypothetical protein
LEPKLTTLKEFLLYAIPKIKEFVIHNFVAKWQDKEFKKCVLSLKERKMVSLVDYVEKYTFKSQNEVQSEHCNFQISILMHINYRVNPFYDPLDKNSKRILIEYLYYVSNDKKHDKLFVQHCFKKNWKYLVEKSH